MLPSCVDFNKFQVLPALKATAPGDTRAGACRTHNTHVDRRVFQRSHIPVHCHMAIEGIFECICY